MHNFNTGGFNSSLELRAASADVLLIKLFDKRRAAVSILQCLHGTQYYNWIFYNAAHTIPEVTTITPNLKAGWPVVRAALLVIVKIGVRTAENVSVVGGPGGPGSVTGCIAARTQVAGAPAAPVHTSWSKMDTSASPAPDGSVTIMVVGDALKRDASSSNVSRWNIACHDQNSTHR